MQELMPTRISVQSTGFRRWLKTTTVGVQCVKGDQILAPLFIKKDLKNPTDESFLLVSYVWTNAN